MQNPIEVVQHYYKHFNNRSWSDMLALVHPEVKHEPNEGEVRIGIELFKTFMQHMDTCYEEQLKNLVFFEASIPGRIAVEFVVSGKYKKTDTGLPEAKGQLYELPAGAFIEVKEGKIARVTTYYNLEKWISLVS